MKKIKNMMIATALFLTSFGVYVWDKHVVTKKDAMLINKTTINQITPDNFSQITFEPVLEY